MNPKENPTKNLNELAWIAQNKKLVGVIAGIVALIFVGWIIMHEKSSPRATVLPEANMDGATTDKQYTQAQSQQAIEVHQKQIEELRKKLDEMGKELKDAQGALDEKLAEPNELNTTVSDLQLKIANLEEGLSGSSKANMGVGRIDTTATATATATAVTPIATVNFNYKEASAVTSQAI